MCINLKVGKKYKTRNDKMIHIVSDNPILPGIVIGVLPDGSTSTWHKTTGSFFSNTIPSKMDIVKEYDERDSWHLDQLLVVWDGCNQPFLRYFAGIQDGIITCFSKCETSKSSGSATYKAWDYGRIATKEDIQVLQSTLISQTRIPEAWWAKPKQN